MPRSALGLDVGGANLKAAHSRGGARSVPFALWRQPAGLADALRNLISSMPPFDVLAVTMTGELCDCFATRREGVLAILDAVERAAGPHPVLVWQTMGFVDLDAARRTPLEAAAANWLALAAWAGRFAPRGPTLLVDVGSTTTDIVPMRDGQPVPRGRTDAERLRQRELVYTGVRRTPLCALLGDGFAAELFATSLDAYLALGQIEPDAEDCHTADGRPATLPCAHARLARMICADTETCSEAERFAIARQARDRQVALLREAIAAVSARDQPESMVLAGEGEFLAREAIAGFAGRVVSLAEECGPGVSRSACAHALAVLASERGQALSHGISR